jgi:glycopeptidolipid biosynthesis protein
MSSASARRLLSIDLLDDDEHDQLDEWGNRAVLTEPGATSVSPMRWRWCARNGRGRTAS